MAYPPPTSSRRMIVDKLPEKLRRRPNYYVGSWVKYLKDGEWQEGRILEISPDLQKVRVRTYMEEVVNIQQLTPTTNEY